MERVEISTATLQRCATLCIRALRAVESHGHLAMVTGHNVVYGLSRMWEVYFEPSGWQTQVFREREQALAWLREATPRAHTI